MQHYPLLKFIVFFSLIISLFFNACAQTTNLEKEEYLRWIGDIEFDPKQDDPNFKVCNESSAVQYFWFYKKTYEGEQIAIVDFFEKNYKPKKAAKESGFLRIRFIVNCEGQTGRFRLLGMDNNYQEKEFDTSITDQLLRLCKQLDQWKVLAYKEEIRDYYKYLVFKLEDGAIKEILP